MEISTSTVTRQGPKGESGAMVLTISTTQTVRGSDGHELAKTTSFSAILLPTGVFLPDTFNAENDAVVALNTHEGELKKRSSHADRRRHP